MYLLLYFISNKCSLGAQETSSKTPHRLKCIKLLHLLFITITIHKLNENAGNLKVVIYEMDWSGLKLTILTLNP